MYVLGAGFTDQPFPNLPQYAFFSTYFGGFAPGVAPGSNLGALRPGLFIEGKWELVSGILQLPASAYRTADGH